MQRPFGGMFLRHRIAEIGEHFAHPALSHHSTMAGDHSGRVVAPGIDDEAQLLRIVRQLCPLRRQYLGRQCSHVAPFRIARAYLGWVRLRHCGSLDLPRRRGKLVAAVRHSDYQGRALGIRLDLAAQADDLHVDAAVVGLGVTPSRSCNNWSRDSTRPDRRTNTRNRPNSPCVSGTSRPVRSVRLWPARSRRYSPNSSTVAGSSGMGSVASASATRIRIADLFVASGS